MRHALFTAVVREDAHCWYSADHCGGSSFCMLGKVLDDLLFGEFQCLECQIVHDFDASVKTYNGLNFTPQNLFRARS